MTVKSELVRKALPDDTDKASRLAGEIRAACMTMARWADDLVDLSSLTAGGLALERADNDPAEILKASVSSFRAKASAKGLHLSVDVAAHRPRVLCDRDRL